SRTPDFLEDLTRVLTQQRGRPAGDDLGMAEAYVVPGQPQPPYNGMLVHDNHIIGHSMWVVEKQLAVSLHRRRTRDSCLLQARQTLGQRQARKAPGEGLR